MGSMAPAMASPAAGAAQSRHCADWLGGPTLPLKHSNDQLLDEFASGRLEIQWAEVKTAGRIYVVHLMNGEKVVLKRVDRSEGGVDLTHNLQFENFAHAFIQKFEPDLVPERKTKILGEPLINKVLFYLDESDRRHLRLLLREGPAEFIVTTYAKGLAGEDLIPKRFMLTLRDVFRFLTTGYGNAGRLQHQLLQAWLNDVHPISQKFFVEFFNKIHGANFFTKESLPRQIAFLGLGRTSPEIKSRVVSLLRRVLDLKPEDMPAESGTALADYWALVTTLAIFDPHGGNWFWDGKKITAIDLAFSDLFFLRYKDYHDLHPLDFRQMNIFDLDAENEISTAKAYMEYFQPVISDRMRSYLMALSLEDLRILARQAGFEVDDLYLEFMLKRAKAIAATNETQALMEMR